MFSLKSKYQYLQKNLQDKFLDKEHLIGGSQKTNSTVTQTIWKHITGIQIDINYKGIFYTKNITYQISQRKCICYNSNQNYKSTHQEGYLDADILTRHLKCGEDVPDKGGQTFQAEATSGVVVQKWELSCGSLASL